MWIYETLSKLQPNSQQEICRSSKKGRWVINCQQRTTCSTNSLFWLHWNPGWHCWCGVGHIASSWQPGIPRKLAFDVRNGIFWGLGPAQVMRGWFGLRFEPFLSQSISWGGSKSQTLWEVSALLMLLPWRAMSLLYCRLGPAANFNSAYCVV